LLGPADCACTTHVEATKKIVTKSDFEEYRIATSTGSSNCYDRTQLGRFDLSQFRGKGVRGYRASLPSLLT
jgi:hypothetical protein